jgi:hypothetical protein
MFLFDELDIRVSVHEQGGKFFALSAYRSFGTLCTLRRIQSGARPNVPLGTGGQRRGEDAESANAKRNPAVCRSISGILNSN